MYNNETDARKLRAYLEKIENLETEKTEISEHINDVFREAKYDGFDVTIMKKVLRIKKMKPEDRRRQDDILDTYLLALGLIDEDN